MSSLKGLNARIQAANFGGRRVIVLAAWYELWGLDIAPGDETQSDRVATDEMGYCSQRMGGLFAREDPNGGTLIQTGRILDGWSFDPGESTVVQRLFMVDPAEFDFVRLVTNVMLAKATALEWEARNASLLGTECAEFRFVGVL